MHVMSDGDLQMINLNFKLRISVDDQFIKELMEKIFIWIFIFQLKNGDLGKVYIIW